MMATADADKVSAYLDKAGLEMDYVNSEPGCIDIMPKGVHKWDGVQRFLDMFGYTAQQVIAAGDFDSDVSMLQGAGIGVAVQNAQPCAKAAADYITVSDNNHDTVADIIDELLFGLGKGLLISVNRK
jgi:hydroxymethylpyrimidine pyrophosphatase-like HAD family hydrolase